MPYRASLRQPKGPESPDASGSMASAGRRTPSNTTSHCTDARIESLPSIGVAAYPGVVVGTRNPRTAPPPSPAASRRPSGRRPAPRRRPRRRGREPDPPLRAVEDPVVALAARGRGHRGGVGAALRLGEGEASDQLALRHARQPVLLLLLGAVPADGAHREGALHRHEGAPARVGGLEFEADQPVAHRAGARAAVALEVHAEEALLAELADQLAAEVPLLEVVLDDREDALLREGAGALLPGRAPRR